MPDRVAPRGRSSRPAAGRVEPLVLRPGRGTVAGWTAAGLVLLAAGAWIVADSGGTVTAWAALALFALVTIFFAVQLLAPGLFEVALEHDRIEATTLGWHVELPWDAVRVARVTRRLGEPWLVLEVRVREAGGGDGTEQIGILLPVGVDLPALHDWLGRRLGRSDRAHRT